MKLSLRKVFVLFLSAALVALLAGLASFQTMGAEQPIKRVFVLNSFNRGYVWTDNMLRGIDDGFSNSSLQVETYVTFMDMKRVPPTAEYFLQLKELIRDGYKGVKFDALLACDNDALEFLRKYRDELFPGVPVVFASINDYNEQILDGRKDITGTSENTDYAGTINLALKLLPATKNIVVVIDATTTGKAHRSAVEKIRPNFPQSLTFTYFSLADLTLDELAQKLSTLSNDSVVLLLQHFVDKNGTFYTVQHSTPVLTASAAVPVFVLTDIRMDLGALGGHLVSGYAHGEAAAQMVVKILNGTEVSAIPVLLDSPNKYIFDYSVMQRFNIAESALPLGSILINKPVSAMDRYGLEILVIIGAFIVLCGILVYLLLEIRSRKKTEQALRLMRISVESASDSLFWMTPDACIVDVNQAACRSLGYTRQELLALLIPDVDVHYTLEIWQQHFSDLREHGTLMFETEHRTKDGRVFPVEIVANYVKFGAEELNCAFVRDISERKRVEAELVISETRFREIITVSPVPMALNDTRQIITFLNPAFVQTFGYTLDDIPTLADWWPKAYPDCEYRQWVADTWQAEFENMKRTGAAFSPMEIEVNCKNGTCKTVLASAASFFDSTSGNHLVVLYDISERKQAENLILRGEQRLRNVIIGTNAGIWEWNVQTGETTIDEKSAAILGYSLDELRPVSFEAWMRLKHSEDMQASSELLQKHLRGEIDYYSFETRMKHKDGHWVWVLGRGKVIEWDNAGEPLWIFGTHMDISERKQAEDEIRRLNIELEERVIRRTAQLEASNKELEAFAYSVSHDLRAPLRAMEGFSSALLASYKDQVDEQGQHYLERIQQASQRMGHLISDLLSLSRITRSELTSQRVDLCDLARDIHAELKKHDPDRQVIFILAEALIVQGDPHLLRIALKNLLENAWKFSATRHLATIQVGQMTLADYNLKNSDWDSRLPQSELSKRPVSFSGNLQSKIYFVSDNGVGFDMAYTNNLFTPFQRLHAMHEFPGTGIGLAIVQRIITRHGGCIWPIAQEGHGASFYFTIGGSV